MTLSKPLSSIVALLALLAFQAKAFSEDIAFAPTEDGLYAVFSTSSGEFAAKLYYDKAPITVGNFVGLAEGSVLRWDNVNKKPIAGKFYEGITFHRVIKDFVIQGGSPNGLGTDGPGYTIPDEIVPSLTHSRAGLLSMAKSGPNSGGSQFFVTLGATAWLDGIHSIFGEIVYGQDKVTAIGNTPTGANNKPTTPVTINAVTILRVGADAGQFDPREIDVPNILYPQVELELDASKSIAKFPRKKYASYILRESTDLTNWETDETLTASYQAPTEHEIDITDDINTDGKYFIEVTEITNPHTIDPTGTALKLFLEDIPELSLTLSSTTGGSYTLGTTPGTITGYYWYPLEDRDQIWIGYSGLKAMQIYLTWTSETEGTAFARFLDSSSGSGDGFNVTGTFTVNQRPSRD